MTLEEHDGDRFWPHGKLAGHNGRGDYARLSAQSDLEVGWVNVESARGDDGVALQAEEAELTGGV